MLLIEAVAVRVENLIKSQEGLTAYALAKKAGMPRGTLWKIIHPDLTLVKTVKLDTIYQIAAALGISLSEFFNDPIFEQVID